MAHVTALMVVHGWVNKENNMSKNIVIVGEDRTLTRWFSGSLSSLRSIDLCAASAKELGFSFEKINVRGGACALGHPVGASGAMIITTLIAALSSKGGGKVLVAICLAMSEGLAVALEVR